MFQPVQIAARRLATTLTLAATFVIFGMGTAYADHAPGHAGPTPPPGGGNPVGELFNGTSPNLDQFPGAQQKAQDIIEGTWWIALVAGIVVALAGLIMGGAGTKAGGRRDISLGRGLLIGGAMTIILAAAAPFILPALYDFGLLS